MSMPRGMKIVCPDCKTEDNFTIWHTINVDVNPETRDKVKSGKLFEHTCSKCNKVFSVEYRFLYHDCTNRFMIWYFPKHEYNINEESDDKKPIAFSFLDINQYGSLCKKETFADLSLLLDAFYQNRLDTVKRNQSGAALLKVITSNIEKISRKLTLQQKELAESEDNEKYKIYGELINANAYALENNVTRYTVLNYYTGETVDIPSDIRLTPSENANKYYKEYRKKQNAKIFITEQIEKGAAQLEYLESVLDLLERASSPEEIAAIKRELASLGYIKMKYGKRDKTPKELKPLEFVTSGGFTVLVGRNNLMNDKLTFKTAGGNDIWLHTKNIHGSHTVLMTKGEQVGDADLIEAAGICAYYSKARESSTVPVDYTFIKFVKRQPSKIPGRVFYTDYKTVYVTPDKEIIEKLKK